MRTFSGNLGIIALLMALFCDITRFSPWFQVRALIAAILCAVIAGICFAVVASQSRSIGTWIMGFLAIACSLVITSDAVAKLLTNTLR